ncbi:metal-sensitive transcriptional regulator [Hydrogenophaga sp.]|uniref:metal-sensitive transcriptional regulator n=1 Tax=Hydrogenophaga sp. TaxID=1904254 RepID=UPI002718BE9A|nr:metal-sensing transcriptional repressor [Hydrogenophaga sp.]MDO9436332.1 metal-sensing transcriptional repressor [Hydrogenophaga sp.]
MKTIQPEKTASPEPTPAPSIEPMLEEEIVTLPIRPGNQRDVINRLKRIEGQVRGLIEMVEKGRACEDVAQQMAAARKAMDKAFYRMMACSVMEAMSVRDTEIATFREVERSTRILEKYA